MTPQFWSKDDLQFVGDMLRNGVHQKEIAKRLGRSRRSLQGAITRYRIGLPSQVMRQGPVPTTAPVFRDPCPFCATRMDADPSLCCPRGREYRKLVA